MTSVNTLVPKYNITLKEELQIFYVSEDQTCAKKSKIGKNKLSKLRNQIKATINYLS